MKRAFTLLELLVVITIMAIMGSLAVSGYRQMRRGMEERSVVQNVNQFMRSAYQRAQIDRQAVGVYFWKETLQEASGNKSLVVVGKAIAVRRSGRITNVQGSYLYDEFGDLNFNRKVVSEDEDDYPSSSSSNGGKVSLYRFGNSDLKKSYIYESTVSTPITLNLLVSGSEDSTGKVENYAFELADKNGVNWAIGDAYGFEFAEITLPHGYIFGTSFSRSTSNSIAGEKTLFFGVGSGGGSTIQISSLRPDSSGNLTAQRVATSDSPSSSIRK